MRSAEDDHQLRRVIHFQLPIGMRVGRGAPARIDVRRDEARKRTFTTLRIGGTWAVGQREKSLDLLFQMRGFLCIARARMNRWPLWAGLKLLAHATHALGKFGRIEKVGLVERRDEIAQLVEWQVLAEALDERAPDIARVI